MRVLALCLRSPDRPFGLPFALWLAGHSPTSAHALFLGGASAESLGLR